MSRDDAWAVGDYFENGEGGIQRSLILHWDGATWSMMPHPAAQSILDVAAVSSRDAWAVGSSGDQGLVLHWDGERWTKVPAADPGTRFWHLNSVAAVSSNDVWAVGNTATGRSGRTLVEHWDGERWRVVATPDVSPRPLTGQPYAGLDGIAAVSRNDLWAVGEATNVAPAGPSNTLVARFDGERWRVVASADVSSGNSPPFNHLFDVAAISPHEAWAVGSYGSGPGYGGPGDRALIERWDGRRWSVTPAPLAAEDSRLFGIAAVSPVEAWAVGSSGVVASSNGLILRWDGKRWSKVRAAGTSGSWLSDVVVGPSEEIWAVGNRIRDGTQRTLVLRFS